MNRRVTLFGVVAMVAVIALWWVVIYSPTGKQLSDQHSNLANAQRQGQQLQAQLSQLQDIAAKGPQMQAQLGHLSAAVPQTADQADFIASLNDVASASGITWQSVTFSPPTGATSGGSVPAIPVQIQVKGGFFQVTDYLTRLETMDRLVVVDGVQIASSSSGTSAGRASGLTSSTGELTVTLNSRIFSQSSVGASAGSTPGTANGGGSRGSSGVPG
jgi:Tfp pilus assembly protein PilO